MTRFYALSKDAPNTETSDRMVFTAAGDASCLPDRPEITVPGSYVYLIECANTGYDGFENLADVDGFEFRCYGAFHVK